MFWILFFWVSFAIINGITVYITTTYTPNNKLYQRFNKNPWLSFIILSLLGPIAMVVMAGNALIIIAESLGDL